MTTAIVPYGFWHGDVEDIWLGHYLNELISMKTAESLPTTWSMAPVIGDYFMGIDPYAESPNELSVFQYPKIYHQKMRFPDGTIGDFYAMPFPSTLKELEKWENAMTGDLQQDVSTKDEKQQIEVPPSEDIKQLMISIKAEIEQSCGFSVTEEE